MVLPSVPVTPIGHRPKTKMRDGWLRQKPFFFVKVQIDDQDYLLWYMRIEFIEKAFEISQTLKHPIDKFHY